MENDYTMTQRIAKVRGLLDDLETVQEAMDDLASADNDGHWLLNYLRNETQTMQTLAAKRQRFLEEIARITNEMQEL